MSLLRLSLNLLRSILTILLTCPNSDTLLCYSNDHYYITVHVLTQLRHGNAALSMCLSCAAPLPLSLEQLTLTALAWYWMEPNVEVIWSVLAVEAALPMSVP